MRIPKSPISLFPPLSLLSISIIMTADVLIVATILMAAIVLFITEWWRVDIVALGVVIALMLTKVLSPSEALAGFSSEAVITIAALFIVGGAILQTGLAGRIGRYILSVAGTSETRLIVVLMAAVALLSGFMSSTGTVAVLMPAIMVLAKNAKISPSRLLIPLAYGSLLGGALTLIGTPPNIIVNDLLIEEGLTPFGFFSFTPMGLILTVVGITFMLFIGRRLLPDRRPIIDKQHLTTPKELIDLYRLPDHLFRLRVRRDSPMIGRTIGNSTLRSEFDVTILKIMRPSSPRSTHRFPHIKAEPATVHIKDTAIIPDADTIIALDDVLIVKGDLDDVVHAAAARNLGIQPTKPKDEKALISHEVGVAEALLPPRSSLINKTLTKTRFGSTYHLSVLSINRPGVNKPLDLKTTVLQMGDTLLVQGTWDDILALREQRSDFIVMGQPESMVGAPHQDKAKWAMAVLAGMLLLMITGVVPVATAALLAALGMVLTGCLSMDEGYRAIDWKSIVLVAGMLPMSTALAKVGLVDSIANGFVDILGDIGPLAVMAGLFLLTAFATQVLSNTATTVIVAPIALAAAHTLGASPYAFLMSVAIAASMAFATPVSSPVNTLVMGAGDYRFGDYMKVGLPMILLSLIVSLIFLPIFFPLY